MAEYAGYGGSVTIDAVEVIVVQEWRCRVEAPRLDTTGMRDGHTGLANHTLGVVTISGSLNGVWVDSSPPMKDPPDMNPFSQLPHDTVVAIVLALPDGTNQFAFNGKINIIEHTVPATGIVTFSAEFQAVDDITSSSMSITLPQTAAE